MADIYQDVPELYAEEHALQRRQKVAEAMALQAQAPMATNEMAGGYVVPISPFAGMAKLLNAYGAHARMDKYDAGMKDLAGKKTQMVADEIMRNQQMANGTPAMPGSASPADELGGGPARPETAAVAGNPRQAAINAMLSQFPQVQKYGALQVADQNRKEDKATALEQRNFELTQKAQDRLDQIRLTAEQGRITKAEADARSADLRRELAAQQADLKREMRGQAGANAPVTAVTLQDPNNPNGTIVIDGRSGKVFGKGPKLTDAGKLENKRAFNMDGIGATIQKAEDILSGKGGADLPTGSTIGNMVDSAAGAFGMNPAGAKEAETMKAVGGALVSKMPRMEGPQSDKDVLLYKEMAGRIGDPTVTRERRIAALEEVKNLWAKYERLNPGTFAGAPAEPAGNFGAPPPGAVRPKK